MVIMIITFGLLCRGIEGEMMRFAGFYYVLLLRVYCGYFHHAVLVCQYIQKLSLARVPFHDDPVIGQ